MKYIIDPERYTDLLEAENEQLKSYIAELEEENERLANDPVVDETLALAKRVYELEADKKRAEQMVERLIEVGKKLSIIALLNTREDKETWERWHALVAEWQARNE